MAPAADFGKQAKALRREMHTVLRQIDYDYQRMQYNTVVSGAMKLLNALEGFKADGERGRRRAAVREGFGILLRCSTRPRRTSRRQLWQRWATTRRTATCSMRPGRRSTSGAGAGRDRADAAGQRQAARLAARAGRRRRPEIEKIALASEDFVKHADGATAKRVIVVPGRLVNVVI